MFRSERALERVRVVERCYLCRRERDAYLREGEEEARVGRDKAKATRRAYRGQGQYVDELLGDADA